MIRSSAHTGDATMLAFPAVIVDSKPVTQDDDPPGEYLFPRIYQWEATESPQIIAARWKTTVLSLYECINEIDGYQAWATNVSEAAYDTSIKNLPVPNGTPVTICMGQPLIPTTDPPNCDPPEVTPFLYCTPPKGVWFSHWVDPLGILCNV